MADGQGGGAAPDLQAVARDWITIWQSELAALAGDRELHDQWVRLIALWAQAAERAARFLPAGPSMAGAPADGAAGRAGATAPAGPAAPVAASDARDAELARLGRRVAELERLLAGRAAGGGGEPGAGHGAAGGDSGVSPPSVGEDRG